MMNDNVFVDPGSGMKMELGKFYVVADDGSTYTSHGFPTAENAVSFMAFDKKMREAYDIDHRDIVQPKWTESSDSLTGAGWVPDWDGCNVVLADDLRTYWLRTDPDIYFDMQGEGQ